jgi:hypothetical protein
VAGLLAYNAACFGNPLDTGYSHDFCWSAAQGAGYAGFTYPHPGPLFDLSFGSFRGLFYSAPFLLLALPGAILMFRRGLKTEALLCLVAGVGFIVLISAYWGWNGGRVDGPRYLVPAVPFFAFPVLFFLEAVWRRVLAWPLLAALGGWSLFATWALMLSGPTFPISWLRSPLFDYSLPALQAGRITSNAGLFLGLSGWASLIPLAVLILLVSLWGRWRRPSQRVLTIGPDRRPASRAVPLR